VQTIDQVMADPQIAARGMILEQDHPELGKIRLPNLPFNFSACEKSTPGIAPYLGQHNAEIAAELGFSEDEIKMMEANGALFASRSVDA
jgi:crotonobetainyl-CoA:carnitine CoA-transferase CaiB-like acyl-CoA transferase